MGRHCVGYQNSRSRFRLALRRSGRIAVHAEIKDIASGLIFAGLGLAYGSMSLLGLPLGTAVDIGPGYFPLLLSGALVVLGSGVTVRGFVTGRGGLKSLLSSVPWRSVAMIGLAILAFTLTLRPLGLFPASVITAFLACLASPSFSLLRVMIASSGVGIFCALIFGVALGFPVPLLGDIWS
jgi:hypothetical protein